MIERKKLAIIAGLGVALLAGSILSSTVEPFGMLFGQSVVDDPNKSITFSGTPEKVTNTKYVVASRTVINTPYYLTLEYASSNDKPGTGNMIYAGSQYDSTPVYFYISENSSGDGVFGFRKINKVTFETSAAMILTYWNSETGEPNTSYGGTTVELAKGTSSVTLPVEGKFMKFKLTGKLFAANCSSVKFDYVCGATQESSEHSIDKEEELVGGSITLQNGRTAFPGDEYEFTIAPEEGYSLESISVVDHPEIEVTFEEKLTPFGQSTGKYTGKFIMPSFDVKLTASFIFGGVTPVQKSLVEITLSGYQTEFTVGDSFSTAGLVVTAHYNDSTTMDVTPSEIVSPDMSTAGQKTVTIKYSEGGIEKTASYTIEVADGGEENQPTVYAGHTAETQNVYDYVLTINNDGTGVYTLTKTKVSDGSTAVYNQYFTWTDAGSGKLSIVKDSSQKSTLCTIGRFNLWFDSSFDKPNSFKNTITINNDNTATFMGTVSNDERTGSSYKLKLTLTLQ